MPLRGVTREGMLGARWYRDQQGGRISLAHYSLGSHGSCYLEKPRQDNQTVVVARPGPINFCVCLVKLFFSFFFSFCLHDLYCLPLNGAPTRNFRVSFVSLLQVPTSLVIIKCTLGSLLQCEYLEWQRSRHRHEGKKMTESSCRVCVYYTAFQDA